MNGILTLKVLVCLLTFSVGALASPHQSFLNPKKDKDSSEENDDDDKKDEDDDDYLGIYIAAGVIGGIIIVLGFLICLCRCCIRRRQENSEKSASSKTVLAVVPKQRPFNSISNESYAGPTTYGSSNVSYDYPNTHSYQNPNFDGFTDSGHYEAPPPYFENPQGPEETISVDISDKTYYRPN